MGSNLCFEPHSIEQPSRKTPRYDKIYTSDLRLLAERQGASRFKAVLRNVWAAVTAPSPAVQRMGIQISPDEIIFSARSATFRGWHIPIEVKDIVAVSFLTASLTPIRSSNMPKEIWARHLRIWLAGKLRKEVQEMSNHARIEFFRQQLTSGIGLQQHGSGSSRGRP